MAAAGAPVWPAAEPAHTAEGLVAHWTFDQPDGSYIPDVTGRGNDAVAFDTYLVPGLQGTALEFNGLTACVRCPRSHDLTPKTALTMEAWVKPAEFPFPNYQTIVRKDGSYALRFGDRSVAFVLWLSKEPTVLASRKTDWHTGEWYHLAATYDGARMRLYINGSEDANSPLPASGRIRPSGPTCFIGSCGGKWPFRGTIDEVRIWRRALSSDEVRTAFQAGRRALAAARATTVKRRRVGTVSATLKKPPRDIRMVQPGFIWIDAEDFTDYGGWSLDTQFIHLMGSPYLIAAGAGKPVRDATVTVHIPTAGRYRIWVRAKNWLKDYSPGRFQLVVNGKAAPVVFGTADTEDWLWQSAGEFELREGPLHLALHDLTGYYGRCDAIVLTTDMTYQPPDDLEALRRERGRLAGLPLEEQDGGEYDVIVVGAGAAGCCAAIAAARLGATTALIQNRPVLGGNASKELGVPISGAAAAHENARESGIIEEAGRIRARYGFRAMSDPFWLLAEREPNLSVFLNQHVFAVEMHGPRRIAAVKAMNTLDTTVTAYRAKLFIDCTGDGWVGYYAGAEYRMGREARDEFNESLAPEQPDKITMSGCIMGPGALGFRARNVGRPVPYTPPPWAPRFRAEDFGREPRHVVTGEWWLEHPGDIDDLWDAEKARDELIRIAFGYWDYIKNVWPGRERAANYDLEYVPLVDAKRESRRLIGDYILTQNDVQSGRVFPDAISYGGWPLDVHHPKGIFSGKEGPFYCNPRVPIYTIPFRCLYSRNIDNLLFAGRDVSVTHIALGSVRVQGTLATLGQAAGTAAALCLMHGCTPRQLYHNHISELQQTLLKHDQYIPGLRNQDPKDLARRASVTASSTATGERFTRAHVRPTIAHPLNMPRAVMFPVGAKGTVGTVYLLLSSTRTERVTITAHVRGAGKTRDFSSTTDLISVKSSVPAGKESWVGFEVNRKINAPYVWVWLPAVDGVSWRLMATAPPGSCRAWGVNGTRNWHVVSGQYYAFYTDPPIITARDYSPRNVINGLSRIVADDANMWMSDPDRPLPQWVQLSFPRPVEANTIYLTFDTDLNLRAHTEPAPARCVRDYKVEIDQGEGWQTVAFVRGNYQRRRVHRFPTAKLSRLRLTILATNGDPSARVFEIRLYRE